jgi:hypothetical protein
MIPSRFTTVTSLPRTLSGKVDRVRLRTFYATQGDCAPDAPASLLEREIAVEWSRVLRLAQIDVNANSFELGGDSLKAMELIAVLQHRFRTDVPSTC